MNDRQQPSEVTPAQLAVPRPGPRPEPPTTSDSAPKPAAPPSDFGRVDAEGTVYLITADGERAVGQMPDATPAEAMEFYTKRYLSLAVGVELLEKRVLAGTIAPDEAAASVKKERAAIREASAVGDLEGLLARLKAITTILEQQRAERRQEKLKQVEAAKQEKEAHVATAEKLAAGNDWRGGVNRFRELLEHWKALPRIDKAADDELWHRFSVARTTYTRRRKAQFAEQAEKRESAAVVKKRLVAEAEKLSSSKEWGPTSGQFRDLMSRWKAAGPAPREVEDELWTRFRGYQDQFFNARTEANAAETAEFAKNLADKEALLATYTPQIKPNDDLSAAKAAYRELLDKWSDIGKVPRDSIRTLDDKLRTLETAIKKCESDRWTRTNPEARSRAEDTAGKLREQIAKLEKKAEAAQARGDQRAAQQARESAATYQSWLEQAEAAAADFGGN